MSSWQLQDAKARLSEVVKKAGEEGPQHITLHGEPAAVVLSEAEYRRLRKRLHHHLRLVTRNTADFEIKGLETVSPWASGG